MPNSDPITATRVDVEPVPAAQLDCECAPDPASISAEMQRAFSVLVEFIETYRLQPNAPPRAYYTTYGSEGVKITLAIPVEVPESEVPGSDPVRIADLPAAHTLRFTHVGPYRDLITTYGRITDYLKENGLIETEADWGRFMPMWEEYLNDPDTTPEVELMTFIHLPVA